MKSPWHIPQRNYIYGMNTMHRFEATLEIIGVNPFVYVPEELNFVSVCQRRLK